LVTKVSPPRGQPAFTNRRASSRTSRRQKLPWPKGKPFRILSLDGGGIKGVYASTLLSEVEQQIIPGGAIGDYFDLMAGTSTGGIIAIALGLRHKASEIDTLYKVKGERIFPPGPRAIRWLARHARLMRRLIRPGFDTKMLAGQLYEILGDARFGDSLNRLVIPAFMVPKAEIAVLKTDHHPDYKRDYLMMAWEVARATSAAPTFFAGLEDGEYIFLDGGLWANNPIMVAIVDAVSAFDISLDQIRILSIGTGSSQFEISKTAARLGMVSWRNALDAAMYLTTDNATAQAQLLVGHENVCRMDPENIGRRIQMDDWASAISVLPAQAELDFAARFSELKSLFGEKSDSRLRYRGQQ
jgi:uncharacterized protein